MSDHHHGSFLTGLTVGLFAGAAGYFLFSTDQGAEIRQEIEQEWQKARKELEAKELLSSDKSLKTTICDWLGLDSLTPKNTAKTTSSKVKKPQRRQRKFKGV